MALLTVVVPVFNEVKTIRQILEKINETDIDKEIIVVDNCSRDGTQDILHALQKQERFYHMRVVYHSHNKGKGESVREGIREARGAFVVIQDADLEYDPREYASLMRPLRQGSADIALGARFTGGHNGMMIHRWGNRFLTGLINGLFGSDLNDYATCYKMARRTTFLDLDLRARSFDIEVEIVCKALKRGKRIAEVPVSYYPRRYSEGKKIRWFDGLQAMGSIVKYRMSP
ncbi:MAG: glycosyltransferase family 2 protein [Candidatus Omnitrophica bacterium]|nr:glycosyltransferase family 2 protein [Candidatus Omnitrophota bacterium]